MLTGRGADCLAVPPLGGTGTETLRVIKLKVKLLRIVVNMGWLSGVIEILNRGINLVPRSSLPRVSNYWQLATAISIELREWQATSD